VIVTTANGHANDSDAIVGDNGDIIRLVGVNGTVAPPVGPLVIAGSVALNGNPVQTFNGFLRFNYDSNTADGSAYDDTVKIVPRAVRLIDYTPGGPDFDTVNHAASDIGAANEVHGESGDDFIYGGKGSDWLYGDGQNDDMIGGYGNDWMSGGTGDDGMIGDDGRIFTSRNSLSADPANSGYKVSVGEPLNGIVALLAQDADPKYSNGNALNEFIFTPGSMQIDTINVSGALKKTVDLTPFSSDPNFNGTADDFSVPGSKPNSAASDGKTKRHNDDIIFGGLGSDWIHGGSGDDAISGAEALKVSYTQMQNASLDLIGIAETDYYHPFNPGDALRFNPTDPEGKFTHPHIANRTGEFALYDENDPLREILLDSNGNLVKWAAGTPPPASGLQFFLNFNKDEGVFVPGGTTQQNGGQTITYGPAHNDGSDRIFGDNGNDWIVGGTGNDHTYGGWGNDLLNAVDDQTTDNGLNDIPVTQPTYEDRADGGAGKDVLIANTGGDRLIDWVGEYNSYLVPFSEFGMATVSRTLQPGLHFFLYADSLSDGVDATRFSDLNNGAAPPPPKNNDPNPGRNGEPAGELALVLQKDAAWHAQTGAPTDPQAGNTPGTKRDVLRSASFTGNGGPTGMFAAAGTWSVISASYSNSLSTVSGDNVSLFDLNTWLPTYYEVPVTVKVNPGGANLNSYVIFDYQDPSNFKYAGIDVLNNRLEIGQRSTTGWTDVATLSVKGLGQNKQTAFMLTVNFETATVSFNGNTLSYTFSAPLNLGALGLGTNSSLTSFTSYAVQKLPVSFTYSVLEDFSDGVANNFTPQTGSWTTTSGTTGRYYAVPPSNDAALSTRPLAVAPLSYVEYSATVNAANAGVTAGLTFATTSTNDFLYVGIVAGTNQVVLGHRSNGNWYVDATASATITAGTDYSLLVALTDVTTNTVNVVLNGVSVLSFAYNFLVHADGVGLFARNGNASFDNVLIRGDDIAYAGGGTPQLAAALPPAGAHAATALTGAQLQHIVEAAIERWAESPLLHGDDSILRQATFVVADLPGRMMGQTIGDSILIDPTAAGYGWFVDATPLNDSEFANRIAPTELAAASTIPPAGRMDLLTVVMHELGHVLGFNDVTTTSHPYDLMATDLAPGIRRLPDGLPATTFFIQKSIEPATGALHLVVPPIAPILEAELANALMGTGLAAALPLSRSIANNLVPSGGTDPWRDNGRTPALPHVDAVFAAIGQNDSLGYLEGGSTTEQLEYSVMSPAPGEAAIGALTRLWMENDAFGTGRS
jgi:hypothetical protein